MLRITERYEDMDVNISVSIHIGTPDEAVLTYEGSPSTGWEIALSAIGKSYKFSTESNPVDILVHKSREELISMFSPDLHRTTGEVDEEAWFNDFVPLIKGHIIECRREGLIDEKVAREWFSHDWDIYKSSGVFPANPFDSWHIPIDLDVTGVFYDKEEWVDFCSRVDICYKSNKEWETLYEYLALIKKIIIDQAIEYKPHTERSI